MAKEHYYETILHWKEGRQGVLSSPDLEEKIICATPPQFPGGVPGLWSPEHLYAASINSCYMSTFLAIAENFKLPFENFTCKTTCKLGVVNGRYLITEAMIEPMVTIANLEDNRDKALRVLEKSKSACLVTNSMKTAIKLEPVIKEAIKTGVTDHMHDETKNFRNLPH